MNDICECELSHSVVKWLTVAVATWIIVLALVIGIVALVFTTGLGIYLFR